VKRLALGQPQVPSNPLDDLDALKPRLMTLAILAKGLGVTIDGMIEGLPTPKHRKPPPQD
jgi:hypothetical protein